MSRYISRIRQPVRRVGADRYLLIALLAFAATIIATRLFLELTGYPQLGGQELHIAHVLWGGLLLFIATLMPLLFANRWVYVAGAVLGGMGVGLFIDEVGKFITSTNDYFYPAAAPIIYVFFLLTTFLYLRVRRPSPSTPRQMLYRALDGLGEVLDHDLEREELTALEADLIAVVESGGSPEYRSLAQELLEFLHSDAVQVTADEEDIFERLVNHLRTFEVRYVTRNLARMILMVALFSLGIVELFQLARILSALSSGTQLQDALIELAYLSQADTILTVFRIFIEGILGLLLILASVCVYLGRERRGVNLGAISLVVSLTLVNPLVFYLEQFSTILLTLLQFSVLILCLYFRASFLGVYPEEEPAGYEADAG